jgi:hypothetical protein
MGLRWIAQRRCIPDLLLAVSASIFGFSVIFVVVALIDYSFQR